jgi:hypothetical protein
VVIEDGNARPLRVVHLLLDWGCEVGCLVYNLLVRSIEIEVSLQHDEQFSLDKIAYS